jgi:hypothetical protein
MSALLAATALPVAADEGDRAPLTLNGFLDPGRSSLRMDLKSITQYPPGSMPEAPNARPRRVLFPGPQLFSFDFGVSYVPLVSGSAADDVSPHLAVYRKYWSAGAGLHADIHLRVLPTADAYVGVGLIHHSSTGKRNWETFDAGNTVFIRYAFDPLTILPLEIGGKGYLPLKAPRGLWFLDPNRQAPMLYVRLGAGPAIVSNVNIAFRRYVNGTLQTTYDDVWWPTQSVLNVHIAFGFEWGSFRTKKGRSFGLFGEVGYRYIGAPVVTDFPDVSDPIHTITFTLGMHLP